MLLGAAATRGLLRAREGPESREHRSDGERGRARSHQPPATPPSPRTAVGQTPAPSAARPRRSRRSSREGGAGEKEREVWIGVD
eukprot:scaffold168104_cov28-Tisochrysis_lutea.AAC.3